MRKTSLFPVLVFALLFAVFLPPGVSEARRSDSRIYFGSGVGYSRQKLDLKSGLKNPPLPDEIDQNGVFFAFKAGLLFEESPFALEFEPTWTVASVDEQYESGGMRFSLKGNLNHLLLPLTAVARREGEYGEFAIGAGAGVSFHDVEDEILRTTSIPLMGRLGFAFRVSEKTKLGADMRFTYSVWEDSAKVDAIWGVSGMAVIGHDL